MSEIAWRGVFDDVGEVDAETKLAEKWRELIEVEFERLTSEWTPAAVPNPRDWPFHAITRNRTIRRVADEIRRRELATPIGGRGSVRIETEIRDSANGIYGTPDRVVLTGHGFYIFDIKTGHSTSGITDAYRRQLLIYAHLVSLTTDEPLLGIGLITAGGQVVWGEASDEEVKQVVEESLNEIGKFRDAIANSENSFEANPSPENCRYCQYRGTCKWFWEDQDPEWREYRGVVGEVVRVTDAKTFTVEQALPAGGSNQLVGVSNCNHNAVIGDTVSVVDGRLTGQSLRGSWYTRVCIIDHV